MKLKDYIAEAEKDKRAIGHFNISDTVALWAIFNAARKLELPVIIGVSEGERDFFGVKQIAAVIKSMREEFDYPIFLNADHTYSFERVQEAVDAGFDSVIFDGAKLPFEENVAMTKRCVDYAKSKNPEILVEAELGYIGTSSKVLDEIPEGVGGEGTLTEPKLAAEFVKETRIDLLAPAVGNLHGMLKSGHNPSIDTERVAHIREEAGVPLVLHGGSGISDEDFVKGVRSGISVVHINTEIRLAYRKSLQLALQENPDEVAPYKFLKPSVAAMEKVVSDRLKLFNGLN